MLGALSGAAQQIAHNVALAVAYASARPLGKALGPHMAETLRGPLLFGVVAGTLLAFIGVMVVVRYALLAVLQRLLSGEDPGDRGLDRTLGFVLGGLKVTLIAYVMMSGLTFVEEHVVIAGRHLGLSPKDSLMFNFARTHNLFEYAQFSGVKDLVAVARALSNPERSRQLQGSPAYRSLKKDPRFRQALSDRAMQQALETGDLRALLRSNAILQLIQDPQEAEHLRAAARAGLRAEKEP